MRRGLFALLLAFFIPSAFADAWDALYSTRLDDSLAYRQARLTVAEAQLSLDQLDRPYLPTVSVGTSGAGLSLKTDGSFSGAIASELVFSNLLGAELSFQAPLVTDSAGKFGLGNPSVTLSRKLFVEGEADRLSVEANLLSARIDLRDAENAVRLQLATEILDAVYFSRQLEANLRYLEVQERIVAATPGDSRRDLTRRILQAQKAILSARGSLVTIATEVQDQAMALHAILLERSVAWTSPAAGTDGALPAYPAVRVQELKLAAAEKRKNFSLLPWLPNPGISAGLSWNPEESTIDWSLGLQFSLAILDRGERALSALQRREGADLERIRLQSVKKANADAVSQVRDRLAILDLDRELAALDVADAEDAADLLQALFDGGFTSGEDLEIGKIDLARARVEALGVEHDILVQKIRLAQFFTMGHL